MTGRNCIAGLKRSGTTSRRPINLGPASALAFSLARVRGSDAGGRYGPNSAVRSFRSVELRLGLRSFRRPQERNPAVEPLRVVADPHLSAALPGRDGPDEAGA